MKNKELRKKSFDEVLKELGYNLKECEVYIMCHRGCIDDALETKILIYDFAFSPKFLNKIKNLYEYYGYDERINCHRFITKEMKVINPTWLLLTKDFKEYER